MRVLILHDEVSADARLDESDVLTQAAHVERSLRELGHDTARLSLGLNLDAGREAIAAARPDVVFNLVESIDRQGRLIHFAPALLDAMNIPYTGAPTSAVFMSSGKLLTKRLLESASLPTPAWRTIDALRRGEQLLANDAAQRWIIKSVWEHASVGLDEDSVLATTDPQVLADALDARLSSLGGEGFAEQFIDGREFNLALVAGPTQDMPQALPPAEIVFEGYDAAKPRVVGYRAKWDESSYEYHHTPRRFDFSTSDAALLAALKSLALECWRLFGLRGYARVDFRVDEHGVPWILEINTNPCISPDAGFAAALDRAGISASSAVDRILNDALWRHSSAPAPR